MIAENTQILKHQIIRHLGAGAFGNVYLARNIISGQEQALKIIEADFSDDLDKQIQEIKNLAVCNSDYVVKLNEADLITHDGKDYIAFALEYLEQGSLENKVKISRLSFRDILKSVRDTLHALNVAHNNGIIHKDVKPANIMIGSPNYKLGDFGLSFLKDGTGSASNLNYLLHAAPECLNEGTADERSDIYAVGMSLFRLVIPSAFYDLDIDSMKKWSNGSMRHNFPKYLGHPDYLPNRIRRIIDRSTAVFPKNRYQTAMEMIRDLERIQIKIDWEQDAAGDEWTGKCNLDKNHRVFIEKRKNNFYCRYKINNRKPTTVSYTHLTLPTKA